MIHAPTYVVVTFLPKYNQAMHFHVGIVTIEFVMDRRYVPVEPSLFPTKTTGDCIVRRGLSFVYAV